MRSLVASPRSLPSTLLGTTVLALAMSVAVGCSGPDAGAGKADAGGKDGKAGAAATKESADGSASSKSESPAVKPGEEIGSSDATAAALPEAPLTEEEKRLLEADPSTLTQEERRQLPYLRRKKIMQNPDSPTAKSLQNSAAAYAAGELPPPPAPEGDTAAK